MRRGTVESGVNCVFNQLGQDPGCTRLTKAGLAFEPAFELARVMPSQYSTDVYGWAISGFGNSPLKLVGQRRE